MNGRDDSIRVLHVDDRPDFSDLVVTFLERESDRFTVESATTASEGLDRLHTGEFDCVVSDYDMPGTNGIEFLQTVREEFPDLPFILFTGKGSEEIASEAISAGVTDYLQKGGDSSQYTVLANRIRNSVEKHRAQAELADREKRLNLFFEQSPLGVIEWDEQFDLVRMNESAEDILGYAEDDLVGRSWEAIVPESDREDVDEVVDALLENKGGYHSVNENARAGGEPIVCEWHNRVVTDDNDDVIAIFSQFHDITERRRQERRLETLIDNLPGMVYRCRAEDGWPMEEVRGEVEALTGYTAAVLEEHTGIYEDEIIHPDDREMVRQSVASALETDESFEITYRIRTADSETKWVWERGRGISTDNGEATAIEGFVTDVTERETAQQEFREEREFVQQALDTLEDVFYVIGPDGDLRRWNRRFSEVTGYSDAMIGDMNAIDFVPENERPRIADAVDEALTTGSIVVESELLTADGDRIPMEFTGTRLTNSDGDPIGLVGIGRDISERRARERRLHETTARLEALFEHSPDLIDVRGPEGTILDANRRFREELGYTKDELVGTPIWEIDTTVDEGFVMNLIGDMATGERRTFEGKYQRSDGSTFPVDVHLLRLDLNDEDRFVAISRDISEREGLQTELETTLEKYQTLVEQNLVGIYVIENGEFRYVNPCLADIFGETPETMIGESPLDWIVEAEHDRVQENIRKRQTGEVDELRYTARGKRSDGEEIDFEVHGSRAQLDGESVIIGTLREVTERERLQATLREEKERFERLLETSPVGITILDTSGQIKQANQRARDVLGLEESTAIDRTFDDPEWGIIDENGEEVSSSELPFQQVMETGEPVFDFQHGIRLPDGTERWLSINAAPIRSRTGEIDGVIAVTVDLSDQREYERTIEQKNEQLEEFASVVSHDLRNPLQVASGRLEIVREECESDQLDAVEAAIERSQSLLDDLLTLAREGDRISDRETVDMAKLVGECWQTVATADVTLVAEVETRVRADRSRLRQLLENLFRNAVEHADGDVTVTVGELDDGFYVADDGPGIPREDREAVFEAGYSTTPDGTGFGLSIVQSIADAHEWDVRVTDSDHSGVRFEITGVELE